MPAIDLRYYVMAVMFPDQPEVAQGTAFLVGREDFGYAVTCHHVIGGRAEVELFFEPTRQAIPAEFAPEYSNEEMDIAVLRLRAPPPTELRMLRLDSQEARNREFESYGFPRGFNGLRARGQVEGLVPPRPGAPKATNRGLLQLRTTDIAEGMSGAPVVLSGSQTAVGMIVAGNRTQWNVHTDLAFAQPVDAILQVWPELSNQRLVRNKSAWSQAGLESERRRMRVFHPRAEFVGRDNERERFRHILGLVETAKPAEPQVLLISGEGGIGKSWLLNELCAESQSKGLKVFYIDLAVEESTGTNPKRVLYTFREQANDLGLASYFTDFDDALEQLRSEGSEIQDALYLSGLRTSPGLIASQLLTDMLIGDLSRVAVSQTFVIVIDGSEKATGFAHWLRVNLLAQLSGRIMIIISGRRDSLLEFVGTFDPSRVHQSRLDPFDAIDTKHYFKLHHAELDEERIPRVMRVTKGNPLATSMLVSLVASRSTATDVSNLLDTLPESQIVAAMARHLLEGLSSGDLETVYAMSVFRVFDGAALAYAIQSDRDVNVEEFAQRLPFLALTRYGWRMHESVATVVSEFFRQARPTQFRRINERAAEFWKEKITLLEAAGISPVERYSNTEWSTAVHSHFWHLMLSNEDKAARFLIMQFTQALTRQLYFITLVEMADELEDRLLVIPRVAGTLRIIHTSASAGDLAQLKESLLRAIALEFCDSESRAHLEQLLRLIESGWPPAATRTTRLSQVLERFAAICRDCDCVCDCACPLSPSWGSLVYYLELTPECNNVCLGCSNTFADNRSSRLISNDLPYLGAAKWKEILTRLEPSLSSLKITGGEPTLHPEFEEIISTVSEMDIPFVLFTNGRWAHPQQLLETLRMLPQCRGLLISLHGCTPKAHEAFSGVVGSFKETLVNTQRANDAGLQFSISTVLTAYNQDQLESIVALAKKLGASQVVFNRYVGQALPGLDLEPRAFRRTVQRIEHLRREGAQVRFGPCIPSCFTSSSASGCLAGTAFAAIDPWGNVKPCTHTPFTVGNLLEQTPRSIWNSEAMLHWDSLVPAQCELCIEFNICHGGCRASALLLGKNQDPLIAKPLTRVPMSSLRSVSSRVQ